MKNRKMFFLLVLLVLAATTVVVANSSVHIQNEYHGIFVLRSENGFGIEINNDIYPDEVERLLLKFDFQLFYERFFIKKNKRKEENFLSYVWDVQKGRGFVKSFLEGDKELLFCFSRYKDELGNVTKGLFLGGNLPPAEFDGDGANTNDTGMAFFDGEKWLHIWCTTNQGLTSGLNIREKFPPSSWAFLGSELVKNGRDELIIKSSHGVIIDGVPVKMDRFAIFHAGVKYFILVNRIKNAGKGMTSYYYVYGDEPWLGDYGSSRGDVGWVKDGLINYEQFIDTDKHSYAGFFDYGNELIGEGHYFTGTASFIEWMGEIKPETAYFSNKDGHVSTGGEIVPLSSEDNRFLGIQWGPRVLNKGESETYILAVGMADIDPITGFPKKPEIKFSLEEFKQKIGKHWN